MAEVEFTDNRMKIKDSINDAIIAWLYESAGELESRVKRDSPVDSGDLKKSWSYTVDESKLEAEVGSPLQNAIWNEYGTGSKAEKGNGRLGYWVFVKGSSGTSTKSNKSYSLQGAKRATAILRSKGLDAYYTNGKSPKKTLRNAFESRKGKIKARLKAILNDELPE